MSDFTTSTGKEITIDLYKITTKEYDLLFDKNEKKGKEIMCKTFGMTIEEYVSLPLPDGAQIQRLFWKKCQEVFKEPKNSESAPTSQ